MNIFEAAHGQYKPTGNIDDADTFVGHSFGTQIGEDSVNRALAEFMLDYESGQPFIVDRMLANAFPAGARKVDKIVEGKITNWRGQGVGTLGTLLQAKEYMDEHELTRPLMVAQAHHVGRVAMQAEKLGIKAILPPGLPDTFDETSEQGRTRSEGQWVRREIPASVYFILKRNIKARHIIL